MYELLAAFGSNILVTEGDEWKRQRKIAAPAFSEVRVPFLLPHPPKTPANPRRCRGKAHTATW